MSNANPSIQTEFQDISHVNENGKLSINLHPGQTKAWESESRFVCVLAGTQGGKALPIDTPIATPNGWVEMKHIKTGDIVYDETGKECTVTGVTGVMHNHDCFNVAFDDGSSIIADAEHQWQTQTYKQRKNEARCVSNLETDHYSSIRTTKEILKTLRDGRGSNNHSIPITKPVKYPERNLSIPPYVLGVWLGDGYSESTVFVSEDVDIVSEVKKEGVTVEMVGYNTNSGNAKGYRMGILKHDTQGYMYNEFKDALRELDLLSNKHIPEEYLLASINQRLSLLQGLMDTDGYAKKTGRCEFTTVKHELAIGFVELVRSLGIKARIKERRATINGKDCGKKWRIHFSTKQPAFRLDRKIKRQNNTEGRSDIFKRYICDITSVSSVPVKCISVDSSNKLYLAGRDYVVTHNTSFGPFWLWREIKQCGPGDYIVVTPTFTLLEKKALPEFLKHFEDRLNLGSYVGGSKKTFTVSKEGEKRLFGKEQDTKTKIFFGHAQDPESLESATAKAAWLDEVGQKKFKLSSWEAIQRRLSIHQGRALFTTTPYNLGWLKQEIWDKRNTDPDIDVIRFESRDNPIFPIEEWYRAKRNLPPWKFNLFYRAIFTKPAGLIYDSFDEDLCKIPRFELPDDWPRYWGLDFGGVNTVCNFYANEPGTEKYYLYRVYKSGNKSAKAHVRAIKQGEAKLPDDCRGGAPSEDQWRREFRDAGLPIKKPRVKDVEVGINRVYGAHKQNKIWVFDDLNGYLEEKMTYSRELDDNDEPTEEIEDKNKFHRMDAERYIIGSVMTDRKGTKKRNYSQSYTTY